MNCQKCGKEIDQGSNFCKYCGAKQEQMLVCPNCQAELTPDSAFCSKCGMELKTIKREDICTSRKGFYANTLLCFDYYETNPYSISDISYAEYHDTIYYTKLRNDEFSILMQKQNSTETIAYFKLNKPFKCINIANVNATGIYVFGTFASDNKKFNCSIFRFTLNGTYINEIYIPLTDFEDIYIADIIGTNLYYTTTNDNCMENVSVAAYYLDMLTNQCTCITSTQNDNCTILDLVGSDTSVYLNLQYKHEVSPITYTVSGWYEYNIQQKQLNYLFQADLQPHKLLQQPELFIKPNIDTNTINSYKIDSVCNNYIVLAFDIIEQLVYYIKPDIQQNNDFEISYFSLSDFTQNYKTKWHLPSKTDLLYTNNNQLCTSCSRHYFDNTHLYWSTDYNSFYYCNQNGVQHNYDKTHFKSNIHNTDLHKNFEVFSNNIYIPHTTDKFVLKHSDLS